MAYKSILLLITLLMLFAFNGSKKREANPYNLIVFQGSDWCANCIRLEKNVLSDQRFISFLEDHHVDLLKIDFPQRKKQADSTKKYNEFMAEKYAFQGVFPTMVLSRIDTLIFKTLSYKNQNSLEMENIVLEGLKELQ